MSQRKTIETFAEPCLGEEIANAVTHGLGALLAIAGFVFLLFSADPAFEGSLLIYGLTLVLLYLASTLYHSLIFTRARNVFRKFDHMAIFLLIAGTYTPFCVIALQGWLRWVILGVIWACAVLGVVFKALFTGRLEWLSLATYILMGWMVIFVIKPIYSAMTASGFVLLVCGGLAYTAGTFFYASKRIPYGHGIWHLWVLAGSALHFFSVMELIRYSN